MMMKLLFGLGFLTSFASAAVEEHYYEWDLEAVVGDAYSPDCMNAKEQRRGLFLANRSFPGPAIEAKEGDIIRVRVTNHHPTEGVAIHWHGLHQRGTPYMDGPAQVTQCALGVLQSQEYVFEAYPKGTHYWHAHGSLHLADGLSGPIIIHPKDEDDEPFEYDEERVLFLQDWYIETSTQQLVGLTNLPFTWIGNPNSLLINGQGLAPECLEGGSRFNNSEYCLSTCMEPKTDVLSIIQVEAGKTYRLRLINSAQLVMFNFAIAHHSLTIVQVEGTNIDPITVDSVDLSPGQRYDVLLQTYDSPPASNFWIETTVRMRDIDLTGQAILSYMGNDVEEPDESPDHPAWDDVDYGTSTEAMMLTAEPEDYPYELKALHSDDVKRWIIVGTQNLYLGEDGNAELLVWAVNNITNSKTANVLIGDAYDTAQELGWPSIIPDTIEVPQEPPHVWNYTERVQSAGGPGANVGAKGRAIVSLEKGDVVEIVLQNARALNGVAEFHPWHSHGQSFWVVGSGDGIFDPDTDPDTYNLDNPLLRDNVNLWPLQWTALRFVVNNPGVWFFHCHITAHLLMGMGMSMVVQPDWLDEPSDSVRFCGATSLATSGGDGKKGKSGKKKKEKKSGKSGKE